VSTDRRTIILDAAELLFSEHGFDGVPVRSVAAQAGVGLGIVTYHFPSKEKLFEDVIRRRADIVNDARRSALRDLHGPTLEELLSAFFGPYIDLIGSGDTGWLAYARLHAMMTQDPKWTPLATDVFGSVAKEMIDSMIAAEPGLTEEAAIRGYVFIIGAMVSVFADTGLAGALSNGTLSSRDAASSFDPMVRFGAAGIRGLTRPT
jgi:AcrR family transcriptional regulator